MRQQNTHTISQKYWRLVTLLICTVTILLLVLQLRMDFNLFQKQQQAAMTSLLSLVEPSARLATDLNDSQLAKLLIKQLIAQPTILEASISSSDELLANGKVNTLSVDSLPSRPFMDIVSDQHTLLVSETTEQTGILFLRADNQHLFSVFYQQALQQFLLFFCFAVALSFIARHIAKTRLQQSFNALLDELSEAQKGLNQSQGTLNKINLIESFGSWNYDINRDNFDWDGELAVILGVAPETLTGSDDIFAHVASSHKEALTGATAKACASQQLIDIEIPLHHSNSTLLWVRAIGRCQLLNNVPVWVEGLLQDVSSTHTSKHVLQLQDFAINQSPDSIFTLDANGCILSVNDTACRCFGYSRDELVGQTVDL